MRSSARRLRLLAALSVAAWGVHELRYLMSFGSHAGEALAASGHAYLQLACPLLGVLAVCAISQTVWLLGRPDADGTRRPHGIAQMWLRCAVALLCVYLGQEALETLAIQGVAGLPAVLVGHGAWLAAPLAVVFGLGVTLTLREAQALLEDSVLRAARPLVRSEPRAGDVAPLARIVAGRPVHVGWPHRGPPVSVG